MLLGYKCVLSLSFTIINKIYKCKQTKESEALHENFFGFELESLKIIKCRQRWAAFLNFIFNTKRNETKPSEFTIKLYEAKLR